MFISYKNSVWRSVFGRQSEEEGHYRSRQQQTQAQRSKVTQKEIRDSKLLSWILINLNGLKKYLVRKYLVLDLLNLNIIQYIYIYIPKYIIKYIVYNYNGAHVLYSSPFSRRVPHEDKECEVAITDLSDVFFFQQECNHHRQYLVKINNIHKALL